MEILLFTVAGILLYFVSDWILLRIEAYLGRRLEYRTLVFFVIILVLSVSLFNLIQAMQGNAERSVAAGGEAHPSVSEPQGAERERLE